MFSVGVDGLAVMLRYVVVQGGQQKERNIRKPEEISSEKNNEITS